MAANKIFIQVDFQSQNAQQNIDALNTQIKNIGTTSEQATKQATAGVSGFSLVIEQATASISKMAASLGSLAIAAVTADFFKLGEQILRTQFALERAFGPEAADRLIQQVKALASVTGESTGALKRYAQDLTLVFKVPPGQAAAWLKIMLDFNATLDGSAERMQAMVEIFGRAMIRGELTSKEVFKQLAALGIEAPKILEKAYGANSAELKKMLKGSQGDVEKTIDIILSAMEKTSKGAAEKLAAMLPSVQFERALKPLSAIGRELFIKLAPALIEIGKFLTGLVIVITELVKSFQKLPEPIKMVVQWLGYLVVAIITYNTIAKVTTYVTGLLTTAYTVAAGVVKAFAVAQELAAAATTAAAVAIGIEEAELLAIVAVITVLAYWAASTIWPEFGSKIVKWIGGAWEWVAKKASEAYEATKKIVGLIDPLKAGKPGALSTDTEEHKRVLEESQNTLLQAQQKNLKEGQQGIEALGETYKEYIIKAKGYEDALRNYRKAIAKDIDTEIKKREEDAKKTALKNAEDLTRLHRQVAIAAAEVVPDSTFAGQARLAAIKAQAHREELEEDRRLQIQRINEQVELDVKGARDTGAAIHQSQQVINDNVARLYKTAQTERIGIANKATEAIMEHDLQAQRDLNRLRLEMEQQYRDERLADELDMIQKTSQLTIAYMRADLKQTLTEKVQQIRDIEDEQEQQIALTRRAQLTAAQEAFDAYKNAHADFAAGVEEEARKLARTQVQIEREAGAQIQMDRLEAWRTTNETIIEEQKKVYEGMKSTVEKVFDALTGKGKSMWEAISTAAKTAVMGAIKEQISSHVAADLTQSITGKGVTFPGGVRRFFGNEPKFEGAGPRPELQPLGPQIESNFKLLTVAGDDLSTAAGLLVNSASALTAAAGAIVSTAGGGIVNPGAVQAAAQTVQGAQTAIQLGGASMSGAAVTSATAATGTVASAGGFGMPPVTGVYQPDPGLLAAATGGGSFGAQLPTAATVQARANIGKLFGIGQPVMTGAGTTVPWASASATQKLGAILQSQGAAQVGLSIGGALALSGIARNTPGGRAQTIAGTTLAGLSAARMFPDLFNAGDLGAAGSAAAGAALGLGVGVAAAGLQRGGVLGLGMSVGGGALAGAALGTAVFPGLGTLAGAAIGAGVGAIAGVIRLLSPTLEERIRSEVKRVYGVDIASQPIRKQIADLITQKYGGNLSIGVYSQDVQDIVRLYALSTGQSQAGLPRPMYAASFAQSQAGGLQVQPVYSGGQLISNPYVGTTTTQLSNALFTNPAVYMQLNPQQASNLLAGQVVKVMGDNPGSVAAANTASARSGTSRTTQASALMEPLTVTR
jgi:hypothetical protein